MRKTMDYDAFKIFAAEELKKHLPQAYMNWQIKLTTTYKVNEKLDALHLMPPRGSEVMAIPNLYLRDFYDYIEAGYTAEKAVKLMADVVTSCPSQEMLFRSAVPMETLKENVICMLINKEKNQELLKNVPHRDFLDLAIIYRILIVSPKGQIAGAIVTNEVMKGWRMEEGELYEQAKEYTKQTLSFTLTNMAHIISEADSKFTEEELKLWKTEDKQMESPFYILTNRIKRFGATVMLYADPLELAAEQLKGDFYVLPSSIHELLLISTQYGSPDAFRAMVKEVNQEFADREEEKTWLSDNIYLYKRDSKKLCVI